MMFGVFTVRLARSGMEAPGLDPGHPNPRRSRGQSSRQSLADVQCRYRHHHAAVSGCSGRWYCCLNVTAGIPVALPAASIPWHDSGDVPRRDHHAGVAAAGFVGLLSLTTMAGRFAWSSLSEVIGRQRTYMIFFVLGAALYAAVPTTQDTWAA